MPILLEAIGLFSGANHQHYPTARLRVPGVGAAGRQARDIRARRDRRTVRPQPWRAAWRLILLLWLALLYPVGHYADGSAAVLPYAQSMTLSEMRESEFRYELGRSVWPAELREAVVRIARCESRFESDAVSPDGEDFGDLQIRASQHPELAGFDLLDRRQNLAAGYQVYIKQGFSAWSCW